MHEEKIETFHRAKCFALIPALILLAFSVSSCGGRSEPARTSGTFVSPGASVKSFGIDVSADGSKLYLADNVKNRIVEMNVSTMRTNAAYAVGQRPRLLEFIPGKDWLLISFEKYDCMGYGSTDCTKLVALDTTEGQIDIEALMYGGTVGSPRTFAYAASGTAYIASGECRWDYNGKTDLGTLYVADLSGPSGATVPIELVSGVSYQSYFGTALSADESTLYVSRGCCTDVCTMTDYYECENESYCAVVCDAGDGYNDCRQACMDKYACRRQQSCIDNGTYNYDYMCPLLCAYVGDCMSMENEIHYFDTSTMAKGANSPYDFSACDGASYIALDDSRNRLYVSCGNTTSIGIMDLSVDPPATSTVSVGTKPANTALSADRKYLFISLQDDDTVSMFDLDSNTVVKMFETGDFPSAIAEFYPYIYVTNVLGGSVTKINYTTESGINLSRVAAPILPDFR